MYASGIPLYRPQTMLERFFYHCSTKPSSTEMNALQTFLRGLETDQILHKFALIYASCMGQDQYSRLNLIRAGAFTLTDVGTAPTFVSGIGGAGGFTANGAMMSTNWSTGLSGNFDGKLTADSCSYMFDSGTSGQSNNRDFGTSSSTLLVIRNTSNNFSGRCHDVSTETVASSVTDGSGLFAFERNTDKIAYREGVQIGSVVRAQAVGGLLPMSVLGNTSGLVSDRRMRLFAASAALGDTGQLAFYNRWTQFKTDIGCT